MMERMACRLGRHKHAAVSMVGERHYSECLYCGVAMVRRRAGWSVLKPGEEPDLQLLQPLPELPGGWSDEPWPDVPPLGGPTGMLPDLGTLDFEPPPPPPAAPVRPMMLDEEAAAMQGDPPDTAVGKAPAGIEVEALPPIEEPPAEPEPEPVVTGLIEPAPIAAEDIGSVPPQAPWWQSASEAGPVTKVEDGLEPDPVVEIASEPVTVADSRPPEVTNAPELEQPTAEKPEAVPPSAPWWQPTSEPDTLLEPGAEPVASAPLPPEDLPPTPAFRPSHSDWARISSAAPTPPPAPAIPAGRTEAETAAVAVISLHGDKAAAYVRMRIALSRLSKDANLIAYWEAVGRALSSDV